MTIRRFSVGSGMVVTCTIVALGFTAPSAMATNSATSQSAATASSTAVQVTTLSAPAAFNVYRDATDTGETYSMSARAPLTGGADISGIYFVLKDVKTGTEVDNSWVGRGGEGTAVYSTSMYLDHASVVALAKHDLVMQAFAYRETDSGLTVASQTPARAMIYAKDRSQVQRVNRVRSTWNMADGSLALTWNTPNYSGDGQVVIYNIWDSKGDLLAQVRADDDPSSPTAGTNSVVLAAPDAKKIDGKIEIIPGVMNNHRTGDAWWISVGTAPTI